MKTKNKESKNLCTNKTSGPNGFIREFSNIWERNATVLSRFLQRIEKKETQFNLVYEISIILIPKCEKELL